MARILEAQTIGGSGFQEIHVWWDMEQGWDGYSYKGAWSWKIGDSTTKRPAGAPNVPIQIYNNGASWGPVFQPKQGSSFMSSVKPGDFIQIAEYDGTEIVDPHPGLPSPAPSPPDTSNSTLEDPGVGTGSIEGYVYADDGSTSTPLVNATVVFEGQFTKTILGGYYKLTGLPLMSSLLTAELAAYGSKSVGVTTMGGQTLRYDFVLDSPFAPPAPSGDDIPTTDHVELVMFQLPIVPTAIQMAAYRAWASVTMPWFGWSVTSIDQDNDKIIIQARATGTPLLIVVAIAGAILIFGVVPIAQAVFNWMSQIWETAETGVLTDSLSKLTELRAANKISEADYQAALKVLQNQTTPTDTSPWGDVAKYGAIAAIALIGLMMLSRNR